MKNKARRRVQLAQIINFWPEAPDIQRIAEALARQEIELRPISDTDRPFLAQVYASTRKEELELTDWSEAQKRDFLAMQFDAQHRHYQEHYRGAAFQIILHKGQPVGRLYLDHWPEELRLVDITLLPASRILHPPQ